MNTSRNFGARMLALLLLTVLLNSFHPLAIAAPDSSFDGIPSPASTIVSASRAPSQALTVTLSRFDLQQQLLQANGREWLQLALNGETYVWQEGAPAIPNVVRPVRLPNRGNVQVVVHPGTYEEYPVTDIFPQQPLTETALDAAPFAYDAGLYSQNNWYPTQQATLGTPVVIRQARAALLSMQPIQYNPATRTLRVYSSLEIEILPTGGTGENEMTFDPGFVPSFAPIYDEILGADELAEQSRVAKPGLTLMLAANTGNVQTTLNPFIQWRYSAGYPTILQQPTSSFNVSAIQSRITAAYTAANPPLEYVILLGDGAGGGGPGGSGLASYVINTWPTDHPYTQLSGTDILADISLSRMSYSTSTELLTMVNRTLNYEKAPIMSDSLWFTRGFGYAGTSHGVLSNRNSIQFCLEMMARRGVVDTTYREHSALIDRSVMNTVLSPGAVLWAHRPAWVGEILETDFTGVNNINKPFVSVNLTCGSGNWYGNQETSVSEALIRLGTASSPRGALTAMSTESSNTHAAFNNVVATGVFYGFGVRGLQTAAPMMFYGKYQLWRNFGIGQSDEVDNFSHWNNVMGDPAVRLWTGIPRPLTATLPATIGYGSNMLRFQVLSANNPVKGALAVAWKRNTAGANETYSLSYTDSLGYASLPLTLTTTGNLYITVRGAQPGQNYLPIIDTITVGRMAADLTFTSVTVTDDSLSGRVGNDDNVINPAEIFDLRINLTNRGSATVTGISGVLSSPDPRVTISADTSTWSNISANGSGNSTSSFRLSISQFSDYESIPIFLNLTTTQGTRTLSIPLTLRTINPSLRSVTVANQRLSILGNTSLALELLNTGVQLNQPVMARLFSTTPLVRVVVDTIRYTTFADTIHPPTGRGWTVRADPASAGMTARLFATFTAGAYVDTVPFAVAIDTAQPFYPTGPDAYGYRAYDDLDLNFPPHPTYQWREIVPALGGSGTKLPLVDFAYNQDTNFVMRLPFPVKHYGARFDSMTICSNGWFAFGAQPRYTNFRNWSLPATEGASSLIAVFWDDLYFPESEHGVYYHYDAQNHLFILSWHCKTTFGGNLPIDVEAVVYDPDFYPTPTGDVAIRMQYREVHNLPGDDYEPDYATVGISDLSRTMGLEYTYHNQYTPGSATLPDTTSLTRAILFTTAAPDANLHWITPRSGDTLLVGSPITLRWNSQSVPSNVHIELNRNYPSANWEIICSNIADDGIENWTVTGSNSMNARLRIRSVSGTNGDTTAGNLIIQIPTAPQISLITPNGGEQWAAGWTYAVTWTSRQISGGVDILLNRNYPTASWDTVATNVPAHYGAFTWTIDSLTAARARLRVVSHIFPQAADTSDADFMIVAPPTLLLSPSPLTQIVSPGDSSRQTVTLQNTGGIAFTGTLNAETGEDGFGFRTSLQPQGPRFNWVDASAGVNGPSSQNTIAGPYTMPFSFPFFGDTLSRFYVCDNGWITFANPGQNNTGSNQQMPYTVFGAFLAVYWEELSAPTQGLIKVLMDSTNQRAIVSWNNVQRYQQTGSSLSFQCILHANGDVIYQYQSTTIFDTTATIGMQSASHANYYTVLYHQVPPREFAVKFSTYRRWTYPSETTFSIPPGGSRQFSVRWDATEYQEGDTVRGRYRFLGVAANTPYDVPVTMLVATVGVKQGTREVPAHIELSTNYPNPFNATTSIRFALPDAANIKLTVFDVQGREVATLAHGTYDRGRHAITMDASRWSTGVYFCRLETGNTNLTRKIVLIK